MPCVRVHACTINNENLKHFQRDIIIVREGKKGEGRERDGGWGDNRSGSSNLT